MQQHLQRQSGVQKAEVSLRDGTVQITPKEDGQIDPAQLLKATYDSGVTVAELDVTAEGRMLKDASGALAFQVEPNRSWVITPNDKSHSLAAPRGHALENHRHGSVVSEIGEKESGPVGAAQAADHREFRKKSKRG